MTDRTQVAAVFLIAIDYEAKHTLELADWNQTSTVPFVIYEYQKKPGYILIQTGVGKANAAAATQYVADHFDAARIINMGTVGCLNTQIAIGEVRAIDGCRFFDVDVSAFGYKVGQIFECDLVDYPLHIGLALSTAKVVSGDKFISNQELLAAALKSFPADFVDMELAAIAHVLHRNQLLERLESYKVPSDYCNGESAKDFYKNEQEAFANLRAVATKLINE